MRKPTNKGLSKAIDEYLDAQSALQSEAWHMSVYPSTIARAERAKKRLDELQNRIDMEAKDEISRRSSKKKIR